MVKTKNIKIVIKQLVLHNEIIIDIRRQKVKLSPYYDRLQY